MENKFNPNYARLLTAACFFAFFIFGVTDNLKGSTLPPMLAELNIDYGSGGNIFFGQYAGFFIASLLAGLMADKYGLKMVMLFASICLFIGISGYSSLSASSLLFVSLFVLGLGLGSFELGSNATIVNIYKEQKGLYLNLMGVMHGLGSTIAPLFAGWLLNQNVSWRTIYRWDLLLVIAFILFAMFLQFPKPDEKSALNFKNITHTAFKDQMPFYYIIIMLYVGVEIGLASWLVAYLQDVQNLSISTSNQMLAVFFALIMLGRLLGGFFVQRFGYLQSILLASLMSVISLAIGIFTDAYFFLPFTGFFLSIMFPTITAAVSDTHHENINTLLGVLFTIAGIGGTFGPWGIAWGSELFGLQIGFSLTLLMAILLLIFVFILFRRTKDEQNS